MYGTDPGHLTNIEKMSSFLENQHEISRKIKIGFSVENSHMGGIKFCAILPCCQKQIFKTFMKFAQNQIENKEKTKIKNPILFKGRGGYKKSCIFLNLTRN